jgi:chromate transporter
VSPRSERILEVARFFLRIGATAFGGPAAHIAVMRDELVKKRGWLTEERFLDLLGAANLIPGPNSTEMAIFIGHARAGFPGLIVAGVSFILPASLVTLAIAALYVRYGALPELRGVLYGLKPVIIAVVFQALIGLAKSAVKTAPLFLLAIVSAASAFFGVDELAVIFGGGTIAAMAALARRPRDEKKPIAIPVLGLFSGATAAAKTAFSAPLLFLVFLKVGTVLFGSGYVLLAFLRTDLVERLGWMSEPQLLDAIAVGQVTPGPVFTTATFIGYLLDGGTGALLATLGIFLPSFFFVAIAGPIVPRLRRSPIAGAFLDGVNVASLALMAVVTWQLGQSALVDMWTIAITLVCAVLLVWTRIGSLWLLLGGALLGGALELMRNL